jgi:hypothetical protein
MDVSCSNFPAGASKLLVALSVYGVVSQSASDVHGGRSKMGSYLLAQMLPRDL